MDVGLNHYVHLIEDTCVAASKEAALDKALTKMEDAWAGASFVTKEWRTGRILAGIDEIQQELDDQIVKTQAMHGSRYVKPFLGRVEAWEPPADANGDADGGAGALVQRYTRGDMCWPTGGARTATVTFECFRAEKLVKVEEPTPCQYNLVVQARAACAPEVSHEET